MRPTPGPGSRRAILSVSDKRGLEAFAQGLVELGFDIVSTGGTAKVLRDVGLPVTDVADVTGAPEMLGGRVKTLHPRVAGGVLANLQDPDHRRQLDAAGIEPFALVCVNLYPFEAAANAGAPDTELIEEIDIGGPTLVRSAAKNHASVAVVTDPDDYLPVLDELRASGGWSDATRRWLALKAFRLTAAYDSAITTALGDRWEPNERFPERLTLSLRLEQRLRYGENPHQTAALYGLAGASALDGLLGAGLGALQGKPLSYNNLLDASAATALARDLDGPAVVIVKHGNPCGAALGSGLLTAWQRALGADPVSAFGGVVAIRGVVDEALARALTSIFIEVAIAVDYDHAARAVLAEKSDLRLLIDAWMLERPRSGLALRTAGGAVLASETDDDADDPTTWEVATARGPDAREAADLDLAWRVARRVSSNAIVLVRDGATVGIGAGQTSRVESARIAVQRAGERAGWAACASDAFFPFADGVEVCLEAGVSAFVQPGGSKRDAVVIAAADAAGATMLLTGRRHFRH
ncbi:bifunctional phosphoribosylaminoimidazolecarboxamide formyltransferase/IMP cyclohydrolase [soil metagenome]